MRGALLALLAVAVAVPVAADTMRSEAAGLRFQVPGDWARVPAPSDMRAAQFRVPHTEGDGEDGELVLFFFGKEQGGSADQNVDRWTGQFTQPDGKSSKDARVVMIRTVNGLKETSVEVAGSYQPAQMGGAGGEAKAGLAAPRRGDRGTGWTLVLAADRPGRDGQGREASVRGAAHLAPVAPVAGRARRRAERTSSVATSTAVHASASAPSSRTRSASGPTQWAVNSGW